MDLEPSPASLAQRLGLVKDQQTSTQVIAKVIKCRRYGICTSTEIHIVREIHWQIQKLGATNQFRRYIHDAPIYAGTYCSCRFDLVVDVAAQTVRILFCCLLLFHLHYPKELGFWIGIIVFRFWWQRCRFIDGRWDICDSLSRVPCF